MNGHLQTLVSCYLYIIIITAELMNVCLSASYPKGYVSSFISFGFISVVTLKVMGLMSLEPSYHISHITCWFQRLYLSSSHSSVSTLYGLCEITGLGIGKEQSILSD